MGDGYYLALSGLAAFGAALSVGVRLAVYVVGFGVIQAVYYGT